jgi:mono/diheme cytochrome c family protein
MTSRHVSHKGQIAKGGLIFALVAAFWALGSFVNLQMREAAAQEPQEVYKRVYSGWKWWHVYCYRCHGVDALGSQLAPNLRESVKVLAYEEFLHIVREGRPEKGMQSWKQLLDDKQITDVYVYVNARSEGVLPGGRPDEVGTNKGPWAPPQGWWPQNAPKSE